MPQGILRVCHCRQCKKARRKGLVLGVRLLKHLGPGAHHVSGYVPFARFAKGRRLKRQTKAVETQD